MTNDFCRLTDRRLAILTFFFDASNLSPLRVDIINTAVLLMLLTTPLVMRTALFLALITSFSLARSSSWWKLSEPKFMRIDIVLNATPENISIPIWGRSKKLTTRAGMVAGALRTCAFQLVVADNPAVAWKNAKVSVSVLVLVLVPRI